MMKLLPLLSFCIVVHKIHYTVQGGPTITTHSGGGGVGGGWRVVVGVIIE